MIHISGPLSVRKSFFYLFLVFEHSYLSCCLYCRHFTCSDEEEEVPTADVAARTSTSHTLVASETPVEGEETSPPRQNVDTATPPSSPRAPLSKRARTEIIPEPTLQLSSSSNLLLEDVSS
jgi:hypothetical protein